MDPERKPRVTMRFNSRRVLILGWVGSVVLAAFLGGLIGRFGFDDDSGTTSNGMPSTGTGIVLPAIADAETQEAALSGPLAEEVSTTAVVAPSIDPRPAPEPPSVRDERPPPLPERVEEAPEVPAVGEPIGLDLMASTDRIDRLFDGGELDSARTEAESLLATHRSYTGLVAALVDQGIDESRARLNALRVLQVAGHELISLELARELKRRHTSTRWVADTIWDWGILRPRILSIESIIERGRTVVVLGTLENPDIGTVRRVYVEVEALDAAGNPLARVELRIRPRVIAAGETVEFEASFKGLDPASVIRTRATVLRWESEVANPEPG